MRRLNRRKALKNFAYIATVGIFLPRGYAQDVIPVRRRIVASAAGGGPAELASDNFNRANNVDLGASWDVVTGEGQWNIATNTAIPNAPSSDAAESYNGVTWPDNQYSQCACTVTGTNAGTGPGPAVRIAVGAQTYFGAIVCKAASNNVEVRKFSAGSFSSVGTRTATWTDTDVLRIEITGASPNIVIKVFQNGSQLGADFTGISGADTGRAGLNHSSITTSSSVDNWSGGSL